MQPDAAAAMVSPSTLSAALILSFLFRDIVWRKSLKTKELYLDAGTFQQVNPVHQPVLLGIDDTPDARLDDQFRTLDAR